MGDLYSNKTMTQRSSIKQKLFTKKSDATFILAKALTQSIRFIIFSDSDIKHIDIILASNIW